MKNKILIGITIIMVIICALGICTLDSTGVAFKISVIMTLGPLPWFVIIALANKERW